MGVIDSTALELHITQQQHVVWDGLEVCPRFCPASKSRARLCTYTTWFARPVDKQCHVMDIPVSSRCMQRCLRLRIGGHRLPKDEGSWASVPCHERVCKLCDSRPIGDEKTSCL